MKVSELSGALLDEWAARAEGHTVELRFRGEVNGKIRVVGNGTRTRGVPHYSSDWAHGGPIIDREQGAITREHQGDDLPVVYIARLGTGLNRYQGSGPTHLIAAMRAYVGSKFGAEVSDEVPA